MRDYSLERLLNQSRREVLTIIARAHHVPEPLPRKPGLVKELVKRLGDPKTIHQLLEALPPITLAIFDRLRDGGGRAKSVTLLRELTSEGWLEPEPDGRGAGQKPSERHLTAFSTALLPLLQYGLVVNARGDWLALSADNLSRFNTELLIPLEIYEVTHESRRPLRALSSGSIERVEEGVAQNFQREVYLYWNYLRDQPVTLTTTGLVPKRHLTRLNEAIIGKADMKAVRDETQAYRLHFIRLMLEEAGLARWTGKRLEVSLSAHEFFGYSLVRRTGRFYEAWKRSTAWNELLRLPIQPREHKENTSKVLQLVARARQYIVTVLAESGREGWLSVDDLQRKVRAENYEFLFRRTREDFGEVNPYYYYHNPLGWGFPVTDESEGWDKVESEFIRVIICEPLHWLGLVSLGYANERLVAFQFTPLGAYLFGFNPTPPGEDAAASGRIVVQPNFQVFALEPIAEQTLASLDRFADRVKADRAFEYRLTRESLYRAQQNGMTAADVIAFLQRASASSLPQNVQRTLEEWGQSYERVVVRRNVSLIHAFDPQMLDALQSAALTQPLLHSRPLPRVAIASGDPAARKVLLRALGKQGLLPAFTQSADDSEDALVLDADGRVTLLHAMPSIFLLQELEQHAERRADGYYLTERVIKAERSAGESIEEIIERWRRWHHGPLPQELVIKLKRWGQFYGKARIRAMRLIQLPSAEVVEALMSDVEIGPYLRRYPPDPAAAFVADEQVETVKRLLEARGIPVT